LLFNTVVENGNVASNVYDCATLHGPG